MQQRKMSYTKLGIMSGVIFLIIIIFANLLLSLISKESFDSIVDSMLTLNYIISRLIIAVFYGFLMVFLFKRKEKKMLKNNRKF